MGKYGYTRLSLVRNSSINLTSTDPNLIQWIKQEIKKMFPNSKIRIDNFIIGPRDGKGNFPNSSLGEELGLRMSEFQGADYEVGLWVLKQLCLQGWEPFNTQEYAITSQSLSGPSLSEQASVLHLRRLEH